MASPKLRLLFVTGSLAYGGAERQSVALMNRLSERGHECHAAYVKREADLLDRIRLGDAGSVFTLGAVRYFDAHALHALAAQIARVEPSTVVAANAYALMYAALAQRLARRRSSLAVIWHSNRLLTAREGVQMLAYRPLFWRADCVVFVCEAQKRRWLRRAVRGRRNEVIYNGVDVDVFRPPAPEARVGARRAQGFGDDEYVIGITAVLRPEKNHLQLVDAIARIRQLGIRARALLIGDGPMRGAIEARARACGVERHVVITGFVPDVRPHVAATDTMTLCSVTEALSMSVLEAMALGKPIVHSDVGGAAEVIVPGENGFLFPATDTASFVAHLVLLSNRAVAHRMGGNARRAVERKLSERTMIDRYERLLLDLCPKAA